MLIALFGLLALALFGGGQESPFVIPKAEKWVKQEITDKERRSEMLAMMKAYKKDWKALQKTEKKQGKELTRLVKDRRVDEAELKAIMEKAAAQRKEMERRLVEGRLKAQEIITPEEWESIMDRALDVKPKKTRKMDKADAKAQLRQDKQLMAIGEDIESAFKDSAERKEAKASLDRFEEDLSTLLVTSQDYPEKVIESLKNGEATREELILLVEELEEIHRQVNTSFLALRGDLRKLSTEENWPKLAKALAKFI